MNVEFLTLITEITTLSPHYRGHVDRHQNSEVIRSYLLLVTRDQLIGGTIIILLDMEWNRPGNYDRVVFNHIVIIYFLVLVSNLFYVECLRIIFIFNGYNYQPNKQQRYLKSVTYKNDHVFRI